MVLHDVAVILGDVPVPVVAPAPSLDASPQPIPGMENVAPQFLGWLKWLLMFGGAAGLFICAIMMAVGRRNRSAFAAEGAAGIPWVIGGLSLGMIATSVVTEMLK